MAGWGRGVVYSKGITTALVHPLKEETSHNLTINTGYLDERKAYGNSYSETSWTSIALYELLIVLHTCSNNLNRFPAKRKHLEDFTNLILNNSDFFGIAATYL